MDNADGEMTKQLTVHRISWQKLAALILALSLVSASGFAVNHGNAQEKARSIDAITDNSFLIEEAYNQEVGVVQHIFTAVYSKNQDQRPKVRGWQFSFTQEWPILSQDHQFSYTIPFSFTHEGAQRRDGIEDVLLNYRYQLLEERESMPAMAPRISLVLPTGSPDRGTGNGVVGLDFNLPVSKKLTDRTAVHFNYGINFFPVPVPAPKVAYYRPNGRSSVIISVPVRFGRSVLNSTAYSNGREALKNPLTTTGDPVMIF